MYSLSAITPRKQMILLHCQKSMLTVLDVKRAAAAAYTDAAYMLCILIKHSTRDSGA